jgi:general secretion pathway protein M
MLIPALFYLNALIGVLGLRQDYQSEIDGLEPRIARLQGLIEYEEQLSEVATKVGRTSANLVYPPMADPAAVSAALQKDMRQILVEAGLSVSNSQVLPVRVKDDFDYIGLKLTVTGDVAGLDAALVAIAGYSPVVLVESLDVWPNRGSRRKDKVQEQTISAALQLLSLRAVP